MRCEVFFLRFSERAEAVTTAGFAMKGLFFLEVAAGMNDEAGPWLAAGGLNVVD